MENHPILEHTNTQVSSDDSTTICFVQKDIELCTWSSRAHLQPSFQPKPLSSPV